MHYIETYIARLVEDIKKKISEQINICNINDLAKDVVKRHSAPRASDFHLYYQRILSNEEHMLTTPKFFHEFKRQYGLQGVDNEFLELLDQDKKEILEMIHAKNLTCLYWDYFAKAKIKYRDEKRERNLGSFFTKLIHTFLPNEFSPIDNPVRDYFGLKRESFYIAFISISRAYREWTAENIGVMQELRTALSRYDEKNILRINKVSDIKILDLVFWYKADQMKRKKT